MTTETDRDIAIREPQKGLNGSDGSQARRLALHELPILGAADSLRRALTIASHRRTILPFPEPWENCDVEPGPKMLLETETLNG